MERARTIPVARFILTACYLGAKSVVIREASFEKERGRPWADLESGMFYPQDYGEPPRRGYFHADPVPIPRRLLMHMLRWSKGKPGEPGARYIVERDGRPAGCDRGFRALARRVLGDERSREVTCHALRNTCTHWLRAGGAESEIVRLVRSMPPSPGFWEFWDRRFDPEWRSRIDLAFAKSRLVLRGDDGL